LHLRKEIAQGDSRINVLIDLFAKLTPTGGDLLSEPNTEYLEKLADKLLGQRANLKKL
jgi:hypothetical protein